MQQQKVPTATRVDMFRRGELRLPKIQRHHVCRAIRVRNRLRSLYRGSPSGSTRGMDAFIPKHSGT